MLSFKITGVIAIFLSLTSSVMAAQGARICVGGAIECQYADGRCANFCSAAESISVSSQCSCPDTSPDNGSSYTGAGCTNVFTALGRHAC
ncbi:unnamed protein product [Discula destructiva]